MTTRRRRRARVLKVDPDRFLAGLRRLDPPPLADRVRRPDVVVDVIRSADLVAFTLRGYGVELRSGANPVLRAKEGTRAYLVVEFPYQHLGEAAIYEEPAPVPDEMNPDKDAVPATDPNVDPIVDHDAPIDARPAKRSRLVFELPEYVDIPFSTEGILEALGNLQMRVHPLAKPRPRSTRLPVDLPTLPLPGGILAHLGPSGVTLSKAPASMPFPDGRTAAGAATLARNLRRVREISASSSAVAVRLGDATVGAPGTIKLGSGDRTVRPIVGSGSLSRRLRGIRIAPRERLSRPPTDLETAIEAPFRLIISPSDRGGWAHATTPVAAEDAPHRIELWHSRLGVRDAEDDVVEVDEREDLQRIVRAVWTRDREAMPGWETLKVPIHTTTPFRMSLDSADRHMLVRQTAETWKGIRGRLIEPSPVEVTDLYLSSLGAWLDLHGDWDTDPYSAAAMASILLWDHVAPMGRDQYVRVVYPGYLYPFGHKCTLVKLTERKMKSAAPSVAGLYQRMFLVVGEPVKTYGSNDLPFTEVRISPLVTPTLSPPPDGNDQASFFVPTVNNGQRFQFTLHTKDQEGNKVLLSTPLLWVADFFQDFGAVDTFYAGDAMSTVAAQGQDVAFAPAVKSGDTTAPTDAFKLAGAAALGTSRPFMTDATIAMKAVEQLSPVGPTTVAYTDTYVASGFDPAVNVGEVWAELVGGAKTLGFGQGAGAGSDKAGGFVAPSLPIRGLSRSMGTIGDVAGITAGTFDATAFLAGALPKLFGIVELTALFDLTKQALGDGPNVVSEALDRVEGFLSDLERARQAAADAAADAKKLQDRAIGKAQEIRDKADAAFAAADALSAKVDGVVTTILGLVDGLASASKQDVIDLFTAPLDLLRDIVDEMEDVAPLLPPLIQRQLLNLAATLKEILDVVDVIEDLFRFLNGLATDGIQVGFRYEWKPPMASWPAGDPLIELEPDSLVLAVEGRAGTNGEVGLEVLAELKDFALVLLPGAPLTRFAFDHLSFRGGSSGKTEVDVVIQDIEFLGMLGFIETIKELIPLDGFSDPPYVDVSPEGVEAGFSLELPNVAIGVFALSNMALAADVRVPFLGEAVTVGFSFCSRERPFTLQVTFIGGGGWFLMRLAPDGLQVLELGLEAGATLSVDFGVASGSVSAMIGVYMRLEGEGGSLTGYFRLRGEVDVLGLITASIELYLALTYDFPTGKMIGEASLTIKVEVFLFSASVTVRAERQFAGSKGDPTFAQIMVEDDGTAPAWTEYCLAFGAA